MVKIVHEINAEIPDGAKCGLHFCRECNQKTLHTRPLLMFPFMCVVNHGGKTSCDGCRGFVSTIAKVIVDGPWKYKRYCEICSMPDSPEKDVLLKVRKQQVEADAQKPLDLNDPDGIARVFGATSYRRTR